MTNEQLILELYKKVSKVCGRACYLLEKSVNQRLNDSEKTEADMIIATWHEHIQDGQLMEGLTDK